MRCEGCGTMETCCRRQKLPEGEAWVLFKRRSVTRIADFLKFRTAGMIVEEMVKKVCTNIEGTARSN